MKIPKGILAGGGGKVGPVVGSRWRGIDYVRAHTADVANPRTAGQVRARAIITAVGSIMSSANSDFVRPYLRPFRTEGQTEQNLFASRNITALRGLTWEVGENAGSAEAVPDYRDVIVFGQGSLEPAPILGVVYDAISGIVNVEWDSSIGANGLATDRIICVLLKIPAIADLHVGQRSYLQDPAVVWVSDSFSRSIGNADINAFQDLQVADLYAYVVTYREGQEPMISNTERSPVDTP